MYGYGGGENVTTALTGKKIAHTKYMVQGRVKEEDRI